MTQVNRQFAIALLTMVMALIVAEIWFENSALMDDIATKESFTVVIDRFNESPEVPDIVAIGDSRIRHGFNAKLVARCIKQLIKENVVAWNLGRGGVMGEVVLAFALRSLEKSQPPKVALLYVDPTTVMPRQPPSLKQLVLTKPWRLWDLPSVVRAGAPMESLLTIALSSAFTSIQYRDWVVDAMDEGLDDKKAAALGPHGYTPFNPKNGKDRHRRSLKRSKAYLRQYRGKHLSEFGVGAIREAIRRYQEAGTQVVLINSAATNEVNKLLRDTRTIGPLFMKTMQDLAHEHGIPFLDHSRPAILSDADFADGDHLHRLGASRYSTWLTHEVILPQGWKTERPLVRWSHRRPSKGCRVVFDFEEKTLRGWTTTGSLGPLQAHGSRGMQKVVSGSAGLGLLSTFHEREGIRAVGIALSPAFKITHPQLRLRVGGGSRQVAVELVVAGKSMRKTTGSQKNQLVERKWNVSDLIGQEARLKIVDNSIAKLGYLSIDQVELCPAE